MVKKSHQGCLSFLRVRKGHYAQLGTLQNSSHANLVHFFSSLSPQLRYDTIQSSLLENAKCCTQFWGHTRTLDLNNLKSTREIERSKKTKSSSNSQSPRDIIAPKCSMQSIHTHAMPLTERESHKSHKMINPIHDVPMPSSKCP